MTSANPLRWIPAAIVIGLIAFVIFGPIANLALWAVAEKWYWPHILPQQYGFEFWGLGFSERGHAWSRSAPACSSPCSRSPPRC